MPIKVRRCAEITTFESASHGDVADAWDDGAEEMTVRELARELRGMGANEWPLLACDVTARTWATSADALIDYRTGEHRRDSLHFATDQPATRIRGWRAAFKAAGLAR